MLLKRNRNGLDRGVSREWIMQFVHSICMEHNTFLVGCILSLFLDQSAVIQ